MKKKNKKTNKINRFIIKNKIGFVFCIICFILLFMSIGFSAFQQTLFVRGDSEIDIPDYAIKIISVQPLSSTNQENNGYISSNPTFANTTATTYTVLPNVNSTITYKIRILNYGLSEAFLDYNVVILDNNQVKYKITGINNGDKIGSVNFVDVYLTLEYWDDVTTISNNTVSAIIDFMFIPYNSNYNFECVNNWDGSSTSEPSITEVYGTNYYQINNANEFAWFVNTVNNGSTNINAYLMKNICLNSNNIKINDFSGILDGQNRTIQGLSYTKNISLKDDYTENISLFDNNNGYIKNLNLNLNFSDTLSYKSPTLGGNHVLTQKIGGLVANNTGIISNVSVSGQYTGNYTITTSCAIARPVFYNYVAGIAATNSGIITGSVNKTNLTFSYLSTATACNYRKSPYLYSGGIVGQNSGYISDSYNNASISSTVTSEEDNSHYYGKLGGAVGDVTGGTIENVYSVGSFSHTSTVQKDTSVVETTSGCAIANNAGTIINTYYPNSCTYGGFGTAVSTNDLSNLNISIGNYFTKDLYSLNNGYPILGWE